MCFIFLSENMAVSYFLFCEILRALPFSPFLFCYFLYISDLFFMKSLLLKILNGRLVRQFISLPLAVWSVCRRKHAAVRCFRQAQVTAARFHRYVRSLSSPPPGNRGSAASHLETSDASTGVGTADRKKRNPPNITHQSTTVPSSARIHRFLMT